MDPSPHSLVAAASRQFLSVPGPEKIRVLEETGVLSSQSCRSGCVVSLCGFLAPGGHHRNPLALAYSLAPPPVLSLLLPCVAPCKSGVGALILAQAPLSAEPG